MRSIRTIILVRMKNCFNTVPTRFLLICQNGMKLEMVYKEGNGKAKPTNQSVLETSSLIQMVS